MGQSKREAVAPTSRPNIIKTQGYHGKRKEGHTKPYGAPHTTGYTEPVAMKLSHETDNNREINTRQQKKTGLEAARAAYHMTSEI